MTPTRRAVPRAAAAGVVVVLGWLALAMFGISGAGAHTDLLQSSPGPAQRAGGTVDFIDLVFVEPISDFELVLEDPSGDLVDGEIENDEGQIIRYRMPALTETGRYVVRYTMLSADGDVTESAYFFTYHPDAVQPVRLGEVDVPSNTRPVVATVAGVVLVLSLVGLAMIFLTKLERDRAARAADTSPAD